MGRFIKKHRIRNWNIKTNFLVSFWHVANLTFIFDKNACFFFYGPSSIKKNCICNRNEGYIPVP